jgi:hypothetical protein
MEIDYGAGLLVIVGAGASHDSLLGSQASRFEEFVPPLTKDLARATPESIRLSRRYRECAPILGELRTRLMETSSTGSDHPARRLKRPWPNTRRGQATPTCRGT